MTKRKIVASFSWNPLNTDDGEEVAMIIVYSVIAMRILLLK